MAAETIFAGAGSMTAAYAAVDWAGTPLGPVAGWNETLRASVRLALGTRFAVALFWGPEHVLVYNSAYAEMIADKHPAALGSRLAEVFPEAWDEIRAMVDAVTAGEANWVEDLELPLHLDGQLRERFYTFSYSPVVGAGGAVEGVMDIAADVTRTVLDRRRLILLGSIGRLAGRLASAEALRDRAVEVLEWAGAEFAEVTIQLPGEPRPALERSIPIPGRVDGGAPVLWFTPAPLVTQDEVYEQFVVVAAFSLGTPFAALGALSTSEALQRSLLTLPEVVPNVELAVRYLPATALSEVGGDWYDAFALPGGGTALVVGDVSGHDRAAAAGMGEVRNLLRATDLTAPGTPAEVFARLGRTMQGLDLDLLATALLLHVEPAGDTVRLRWTNAGHPPPVLLTPDGRAVLLDQGSPDLLIGLDPESPRSDRSLTVAAGATVVLYTDGLVERRGEDLDVGLERLRAAVQRIGGRPEELVERLLAELVADDPDDDVVLLVARLGE